MSITTEDMEKGVRKVGCFNCRSLKGRMPVLDFGVPYLNDFVLPEERHRCRQYNLKLMWCPDCKVGQLNTNSPADWHFRNYWYKSGLTNTMRSHLQGIVAEASEIVDLRPGDAVVDIGSNDGTMLRMYDESIRRIGFEPALNLLEQGREGGNEIIPEYFDWKLMDGKPTAKIITAISMFYDLADPLTFLRGIRIGLHPEGIFVLQMNYAKAMLENTAFDNVGHEHLTYYNLLPLKVLLNKAELEPFKVTQNDLNGGSIRILCKHKTDNMCSKWRDPRVDVDESVDQALFDEQMAGVNSYNKWAEFGARVWRYGSLVTTYMDRARSEGEHVWLYGASTRGSTLCQAWKIDKSRVEGAAERDERKVGRMTSGTWIPIRDEIAFRNNATIGLVLPWHFRDEILKREREWLDDGGTFIFPLPRPCIYTKKGMSFL